jgi:type II secretory pathway component PulK
MKKLLNNKEGQALLTLLVFSIVAMTVASASVAIMLNVAQGSTQLSGATSATQIAESGIENALLRLLRDPSYTGETLTVGSGSVVVNVSGTTTKTITATGTIDTYSKTVQATVSFANNIMQVTSWTGTN